MSPKWSKSTVFQTVNKVYLHAEHAPVEKTDFKSVATSNLPALAGSGLDGDMLGTRLQTIALNQFTHPW